MSGSGRLFVAVIAAGLSLLCDARVYAAFFVVRDPITGTASTITPNPDGTFDIALSTTVITMPTTFTIIGGAADRLNAVTVLATVPQFVFVDIHGASSGPIASVNLIDKGVSSSTVLIKNLVTTGNVGSIFVNTIIDMTIGGDVTGGITLLQRPTGGTSTLINATVQGRILGDVIVDHGDILALNALGGIGLPGSPAQVRTSGNLVSLLASDIVADISTLSAGGNGATSTIQTTTGSFTGTLATRSIQTTEIGSNGALLIAGDLDADVLVLENIANDNGGLPVVSVGGSFMPNREINVGGSLLTGAEMSIASPAGLQGQVVINSNDLGGAWSGPVRIGGSLLGPVPAYASASSSLGGGAVGQVPFALHGSDSVPAPGSVLGAAQAPTTITPIRLRYYGPITWASGVTPVLIERRPVTQPNAWQDVTSCFLIGRGTSPVPDPNVIALFPIFHLARGTVYRVTPVLAGTNRLQCDLGLQVNPAVAAAAGPYTFSVVSDCLGDANFDRVVDFSDVTSVLGRWNAADLCDPTGDANGDALVNFSDVTSVLGNWNSACAP